jgi:hypothetical protein
MKKIRTQEQLGHNISYPQMRQGRYSVGVFSLDFLVLPDRKSPAIRLCV